MRWSDLTARALFSTAGSRWRANLDSEHVNRRPVEDAADSRRRLTGIVLVFLSTIAWSSGGLFVRLLPYDMWTIVFWRGVFGTLFIGTFVLWRFGADTGAIIRRMGRMGVAITACSVATITFFVPAFQHTSIANAMTIYA